MRAIRMHVYALRWRPQRMCGAFGLCVQQRMRVGVRMRGAQLARQFGACLNALIAAWFCKSCLSLSLSVVHYLCVYALQRVGLCDKFHSASIVIAPFVIAPCASV